jgi:hypothetical protein
LTQIFLSSPRIPFNLIRRKPKRNPITLIRFCLSLPAEIGCWPGCYNSPPSRSAHQVTAFLKPERWQEVQHLLQETLKHESGERSAFLEHECAGDAALCEEVESLIASAQLAQSFLKGNALEDGAELLAEVKSESLIGQPIGYYLIEKQIGAGWKGEFYLAGTSAWTAEPALKRLDPGLTGDEPTRLRLLRQVRLTSAHDA